MEDEELRELFAVMSARVLVMREVLARLIAYEAGRQDADLLEDFSNFVDSRIYHVSQDQALSAGGVGLQEVMRQEIDRILAISRAIIVAGKEDWDH